MNPCPVPAQSLLLPTYVRRGLPCGISHWEQNFRPGPIGCWPGEWAEGTCLCTFYRSFMNNWEVYKLLAHVRPPVSKVLASSPYLTLCRPSLPL